MALISNIVIDLASATAVLTVTKGGMPVETITYENVGKTNTIATRDGILISGAEFIDLCNQINVFQTSIVFNFNPNIYAVTPFTSIDSIEQNNISTWDFTFVTSEVSDPNFVQYSAILADVTVDLAGRHANRTLYKPEWMYFLFCLTHYRISVKSFLSL